jgi:hypothetical protein
MTFAQTQHLQVRHELNLIVQWRVLLITDWVNPTLCFDYLNS